MTKRNRVDGARTRERVLKAATPLFARYGRNGVGLREIAREGGVAAPTIPYHFGSKGNLYREAASNAIHDIDFNAIFEDSFGIDYADKQQVADSLFSIINNLGMSMCQPQFTDKADLACQALFCHDIKLQHELMDAFDHFEVPFLEFLDKVGIEYTMEDKAYWLVFLWSQMLFYVSAREFVCVDLEIETIPQELYVGIAWKTAHFLCMEFGLPDPQMR